MRVDRRHLPWALTAAGVTAVGGLWYTYELRFGGAASRGWSGGSLPGLVLGSAGYGCMLLAGALAPRKWMRTFRLGRAQMWVRMHIWVGLLALPLIWLHGGFRHGGPLTEWLMYLLYAVWLSGLAGWVIQHVYPSRMLNEVPTETVATQIGRVRRHLAADARLIVAACGPIPDEEADIDVDREIDGEEDEDSNESRPTRAGSRRPAAVAAATNGNGNGGGGGMAPTWLERVSLRIERRRENSLVAPARARRWAERAAAAPLAGSEELRAAYAEKIRPFLAGKHLGSPLRDAGKAREVFRSIYGPPAVLEVARELEDLVTEYRDTLRQRRLDRVLHGWLLVHIPLSVAVIVLGGVHAVQATRFKW